MLHADGTHSLAVLGPDLRAGQLVQLRIPGDTFHTARIIGARRWFLGASTEWPGVIPSEDVELGNAETLVAKYPDVADAIHSFPVPVGLPIPFNIPHYALECGQQKGGPKAAL
jgi:predicted cupin superfamily sugar epimerase